MMEIKPKLSIDQVKDGQRLVLMKNDKTFVEGTVEKVVPENNEFYMTCGKKVFKANPEDIYSIVS